MSYRFLIHLHYLFFILLVQPTEPINFSITFRGKTNLTFTWEKPQHEDETFQTKYKLVIHGASFDVDSSLSLTVINLFPFTTYKAQVCSYNEVTRNVTRIPPKCAEAVEVKTLRSGRELHFSVHRYYQFSSILVDVRFVSNVNKKSHVFFPSRVDLFWHYFNTVNTGVTVYQQKIVYTNSTQLRFRNQ